jgi:hypothetical protein
VAVRLVEEVGPNQVIATARKLLVRIYYILKDKKLQVTLDMPASVPGLS